jgi:CRP-like cAMP-binding protein
LYDVFFLISYHYPRTPYLPISQNKVMNRLYEYIQRFAVVSQQEFEQINALLELKRYEKKVTLTQRGQVENYLYMVNEGLVRKYFYKGKHEMITQIAKEGDMVCSSVSFLAQEPYEYVVETLEPSTVYAISYGNMQKLYGMGYKMERLGRLIILDWLLQKEIWDYERIRQEPRERFKHFMRENNDLVQRVPQKYLASYLNMKPETFSRYKHFLK